MEKESIARRKASDERFVRWFVIGFALVEALLIGFALLSRGAR